MHKLSRLVTVAALTLATQATAQLAPVGYRDVALPNRTGVGLANIPARVFYPAATTGKSTAIRQTPSQGWPVIVLLPGIGQIGNDYPSFANFLAANGFVLVMLNASKGDLDGQRDNGSALFSALRDANQQSSSFLYKKLDVNHIALAGHSSGGGNIFRILAINPGYAAGVAFAPWQGPVINGKSFPHFYAPHIKVPILLVHGEGDPHAIWQDSSKLYFEQLTNRLGTKTFYLMGKSCDHANLISLLGSHVPSAEVFFDSMSATIGFLGGVFTKQTADFEDVVGITARARQHTSNIKLGVDIPLTWTTGEAKLGSTITVHTAAHEGFSTLFVAGKTSSLTTPFGLFMLDPSTAYAAYVCKVGSSRLAPGFAINIPNDPRFLGFRLVGQTLSAVSKGGMRLSPTFAIDIQ